MQNLQIQFIVDNIPADSVNLQISDQNLTTLMDEIAEQKVVQSSPKKNRGRPAKKSKILNNEPISILTPDSDLDNNPQNNDF
jgi:hypothetical protein